LEGTKAQGAFAFTVFWRLVISSWLEPTPPISTRAAVVPWPGEAGTLGTGFINGQWTPFQCLPVQARDGSLKIFAFCQLNESKSLAFTAHLVPNHHG